MKPVILGIDSRCEHGAPVALGGEGCGVCQWENLISSKRPPFSVRCIDAKGTNLKEDSSYTVRVVVMSGRCQESEKEIPGFLLATENGCGTRPLSIHRFILKEL